MFHGYDIRAGLRNPQRYHKLFSGVDNIFSISEYNRRSLLSMGAPAKMLINHSVGVDSKTFFPLENRKQNSHTTIVTVARLVEEKGLIYGIHAIASLKESGQSVTWKIVGEGNLRAELEREVQRLKLDKQVQFLGARTTTDVLKELRRADVFFLPSIAEALPVCLMEAMSVGLPIVATNVGSVNELVLPNKTGILVDSRNSEQMATALAILLRNTKLRRKFGRDGRRLVKMKYDIHKLNKQLERIFYTASNKTKSSQRSSKLRD
jgi:colanic acid/amylovoran biosynthesis glycosyltransferase